MKETWESEDFARTGLFLSTGGILYPSLYRGGRTELVSRLTGLDAGIAPYVHVLREAGVETYESCQGGPGHAAVEPIVRFFGVRSEGFRALDVALKHGLPVLDLRRFWQIVDGEPCGPYWELAFREGVAS
jgi:hypothetical protein